MAAACVELNREIRNRICTRGFTEMLRINQENTMQHLAESNERLRNQKRMLEEDLVGQTQQKKLLKRDANLWKNKARRLFHDIESERYRIKDELMGVLERFQTHTPFNQREPEMRSIIDQLCRLHNSLVDEETESEDA